MRFGAYLQTQRRLEWSDYYIDYNRLKAMIKALSKEDANCGPAAGSVDNDRTTSFTTKKRDLRINNVRKDVFCGKPATEASFFAALEDEMAKIDNLTQREQIVIKTEAEALESSLENKHGSQLDSKTREEIAFKAKALGDRFLTLEKFVNLNYLGFHKILKKHDKQMPTPCRRFYLTRMHNQRWVRNDYSKLFVELSKIHSWLRGDISGKDKATGSQNFVRSTSKFWVRTEDVSRVKHTILQHLPVFQHNLDLLSGDSQFCSSVYFDNTQMELYHGRLDKTPHAIAIRFRWYATAEPELVFVERKTHNDSWTGKLSVKERFTLLEHQVMPFLHGEYTVEKKLDEMRAKDMSESDMENTRRLFTEIYQQIESKQLRPTLRTVYNRVAYQIPFDSSVRISLDNNLTMVVENPKVGPDCATEKRWYRNPNIVVPPTDITQFPHAVLEVKLSIKEGQDAPEWVQTLINSNLCTRTNKFSKFIHGCAILLPEQVQAFPYWIDDVSIRPSILRSQPIEQRRASQASLFSSSDGGYSGNKNYESYLGTYKPILLMLRKPSQVIGQSDDFVASASRPLISDTDPLTTELGTKPRKMPMKIEPKVFFSNERTLLSWVNISITLGALSTAFLGYSNLGKMKAVNADNRKSLQLIGFALMPISIMFAVYALTVFRSRRKNLRKRIDDGNFFDQSGPLCLGIVLMVTLTTLFVIKL